MDAGGPYGGDEGALIPLSGSASDHDGDSLTIRWSFQVGAPCSFSDAAILAPTIRCSEDGAYQLTLTVSDGFNPPVSDGAMLTVADVPPTVLNRPPDVSAGGPYAGTEGTPVPLSGSASDPDGDALALLWSYAPGADVDAGASCTFSDASSLSPLITCTDDGAYTLTLTASDGNNPPVAATATLRLANVAAPVTITAPGMGALYTLGSQISLAASFGDPGANDTHSCSVNWDDGTAPVGGMVQESDGTGTCTQSRTPAAPGVYTVAVTITDDDGGTRTNSLLIVVYDPDGGFVTGGGWIMTQAGSYVADPSLSGRANFGFVSKYHKGASVPEGQTEFQFQQAGLNFHSEAYQWLVVAGHKAQYKGTGTINGQTGYTFLITVTDGDLLAKGEPDRFRIKIWNSASGGLIYDNARGSSDDMDSANPQALSGGSIVIHK